MLRIVIRPRAAADLDEAVDYYNRAASPEVAGRFIDEFLIARDLIAERPGIGSRRFAHLLSGASLRFWSFDRFPFRIFTWSKAIRYKSSPSIMNAATSARKRCAKVWGKAARSNSPGINISQQLCIFPNLSYHTILRRFDSACGRPGSSVLTWNVVP